ncbi:hypothetical protein OF83DRAFT_1135002 [Amylostereum chailletii]|nr:hypothetical protein OF83DRAFT_1135002 [Amylostereum chailletii]
MSEGLSAEAVQDIAVFLATSVDDKVFPVIVEAILFAWYTILVFVSSYVLISRGMRIWTNRAMLAIILVMYTLNAFQFSINVRNIWARFKVYLPLALSPGDHTDAELAVVIGDANWLLAQNIALNVTIVLGDLVVLWRACVVWAHRRFVVATALFLVLGLVVLYLVDAIAYIALDLPTIPVGLRGVAQSSSALDIASLTLSGFANIWATAMIVYKAWIHRRDIHQHLQGQTKRTRVETILALLVDTGIVYSLIWLVTVILSDPYIVIGSEVMNAYFWAVMEQVSGIYPTFIIAVVAMQKSHLEHQFSYTRTGAGIQVTLPFAARVPTVWSAASRPADVPAQNVGGSEDAEDFYVLDSGVHDVNLATTDNDVSPMDGKKSTEV